MFVWFALKQAILFCIWVAATKHWHKRAQGGSTALFYAVVSADCARLLLDAGADKNAKDRVRASGCDLLCGAVVMTDLCIWKHAIFAILV